MGNYFSSRRPLKWVKMNVVKMKWQKNTMCPPKIIIAPPSPLGFYQKIRVWVKITKRSIFLVLWLVNPIPYTLNNTLNSKFPLYGKWPKYHFKWQKNDRILGKRSFCSFQMIFKMKLQKKCVYGFIWYHKHLI